MKDHLSFKIDISQYQRAVSKEGGTCTSLEIEHLFSYYFMHKEQCAWWNDNVLRLGAVPLDMKAHTICIE